MFPDFRQAFRKLRRSPFFTSIAVLTLALGIGANAAVFSVVYGVLLKPLPFDEPERLVGIWYEAPGLGFEQVNQSPATYFTHRDDTEMLEDLGLWDNSQVSVTGLEKPMEIEAMLVTDGTLPILRVRPELGRLFSAEDDLPDAPETVMLSHGFWKQQFGGDASVVGQTLRIDGRPREIIGVLPAGFRVIDFDAAVYLPMGFEKAQARMGNFSYQGLGRLVPGATLAQLEAEMNRLIPVMTDRYPGGITLSMLQEARFAAYPRSLKQDVVGDVGSALWVLLGTVGLVLLIACANVANLFLVRADGRQLEVAVRTAMGASRMSVVRSFLAESVLLGLLGGIAGLALAFAGLRLLVALGPRSLPRLQEISIDPTVILFTAGVSLLAGVLFGLVPGLRSSALGGLAVTLKEGGYRGSEGRQRRRARHVLVVSQVALALVLLVGSGLMIRSFQALQQVDPGFRDPADVLTLRVSLPRAEVETVEQVIQTFQQMYQNLAAIPGVSALGMSSSITMDGWDNNDALYVEDAPTPEGQLPPIRRDKRVAGDYVATMGNRLLAGRAIDWNDSLRRNKVVMLTEDLATTYWDSPAEAIGKRVSNDSSGDWYEVVGVVGDIRDNGVSQPTVPTVYWPMVVVDPRDGEVNARRAMAFALRHQRPDEAGLVRDVQDVVWSINPNLPLANLQGLDEILGRSMARTSFVLVMLAIAAVVALLLGSVGIYGVTSYSVTQRTREIGVRLALGAGRGDVSGMVLRQAATLAAIGVGVGLAAAFGLTRLMTSLLHGVEAVDPPTYVAVALALVLFALLASWLPARRAARTDPMVALRWE